MHWSNLAILELLQAEHFIPFHSFKTVINGAIQYPCLFSEKMQSVNIAMPEEFNNFIEYPIIQEIILKATNPEHNKRPRQTDELTGDLKLLQDDNYNISSETELADFNHATDLCYDENIGNRTSLKLQLSQGIDLNSSGYDEFESSFSPRDLPATPKITRSQSQKSKSTSKSIFKRIRRQTDRF